MWCCQPAPYTLLAAGRWKAEQSLELWFVYKTTLGAATWPRCYLSPQPGHSGSLEVWVPPPYP